MYKTYKETIKLRTANCDVNSCWRPNNMLEIFQELANAHCETLDCGRGLLLEKGVAWVLARYEIDMKRWPKIDEEITVETVPMPLRRFLFPRFFIVTDSEGNEIGRAQGIFSLLDINTRSAIMDPTKLVGEVPDNSERGLPTDMPPAVVDIEGEETELTYALRYSDLDFNGHMNNTKYLELLIDTLGIETMNRYELAHVLIQYKSEVLPDSEVTLRLKRSGLEFVLAGDSCGKNAFKIGGELRARS